MDENDFIGSEQKWQNMNTVLKSWYVESAVNIVHYKYGLGTYIVVI